MSNPGYAASIDRAGLSRTGPQRVLAGVLGIVFGLFALAGCAFYLRGSPLVDPLPAIAIVWAFSVGAFLGLLLVYVSPLAAQPHVYAVMLIVCGLLAIPNLEAAVETYAFHHVVPQTSQRLALIVGRFTEGKYGGYCVGLRVQPYPGARSLYLRTDPSICRGVPAVYWAHSPQCYLIDVETGRHGIKRASAPMNEDRRRPCPGA